MTTSSLTDRLHRLTSLILLALTAWLGTGCMTMTVSEAMFKDSRTPPERIERVRECRLRVQDSVAEPVIRARMSEGGDRIFASPGVDPEEGRVVDLLIAEGPARARLEPGEMLRLEAEGEEILVPVRRLRETGPPDYVLFDGPALDESGDGVGRWPVTLSRVVGIDDRGLRLEPLTSIVLKTRGESSRDGLTLAGGVLALIPALAVDLVFLPFSVAFYVALKSGAAELPSGRT